MCGEAYFTSEIINLKLKAALKNRLIAILCVGEKTREESGNIGSVVGKQLEKGLKGKTLGCLFIKLFLGRV